MWTVAVSGKKKLRIQKYPDTCGRGLSCVANTWQLTDSQGGSKGFFCCCSACETMEDYKEGYLRVWANCMSPCNSIVGLYFEGTCDVISVTMATHKVDKNVH